MRLSNDRHFPSLAVLIVLLRSLSPHDVAAASYALPYPTLPYAPGHGFQLPA
jgi:hypothetical protein